MKRIIEGVDRSQTTLFPDRLEEGGLPRGTWRARADLQPMAMRI